MRARAGRLTLVRSVLGQNQKYASLCGVRRGRYDWMKRWVRLLKKSGYRLWLEEEEEELMGIKNKKGVGAWKKKV